MVETLLRREHHTPYGWLIVGDRVELVGTRPVAGTVAWVRDDPTGLSVGVRWDNGSTLPMRPCLGDRIRKATT